MRVYAGIGSRQTPPSVLTMMHLYAQEHARDGWMLSSGGAQGADTAFETGARSVQGLVRIYRPYDAIAVDPTYRAIAAAHHPNWSACSDFARRAHTRNVAIILGGDPAGLTEIVQHIAFWTPGGTITGGTGMALRLATTYHIPTIWLR